MPIRRNKPTFQLRESCRDSIDRKLGSINSIQPNLRSSNRGALTRSNVGLFLRIGIMLKTLIYTCVFLLSHSLCSAQSPDDALNALVDGNKRFYSGESKHTQWNKEARLKKSGPQEPFAAILSCSDSRVPPEIIFDQGLGDLFIVRDAGNVVGDIELASIEYAAVQLHAPLILVLGHQECGAVKAVLNLKEGEAGLRGIYPLISSAINSCKEKGKDPLKHAICCNVRGSMKNLETSSPALSSLLKQKKLKIVGGYYDFNSGQVGIIPQ